MEALANFKDQNLVYLTAPEDLLQYYNYKVNCKNEIVNVNGHKLTKS